jgi:hypothetical protein
MKLCSVPEALALSDMNDWEVLGAAEVDAGAEDVSELEPAADELCAGEELDADELGAEELSEGDELSEDEVHVVVGKNWPRARPLACASTWTKHLPSAELRSETVTQST